MSQQPGSIVPQSVGPKSGIDLATALLNAANGSNPILTLVHAVGEWMGREGVPETALLDCLIESRGLTYPNDLGTEFCGKVRRKQSTRPILGKAIFIYQSGSLGRRLLDDPQLCWLVTTATCLFQRHNDPKYIAGILLEFVVSAHTKADNHQQHDSETPHSPIRVSLSMVLEKLVLSVWQNVVNSEHFAMELPEELKHLCPANTHSIHQTMMGRLMYDIAKAQGNMVLQTPVFMNALYFWLMHHFAGELIVVISSKEVSRRSYGTRSITFEMRVEYSCDGKCADPDRPRSRATLWTEMGGSQTQRKFSIPECRTTIPGARGRLYEDVENYVTMYHTHHRVRMSSLQQDIKGAAGRILKWVLSRTIVKPLTKYGYGFQIGLEAGTSGNTTKVADVMLRTPGLLNLEWPFKEVEIAVYRPAIQKKWATAKNPDIRGDETSADATGYPREQPTRAKSLLSQPGEAPVIPSELIRSFPILEDLLKEAGTWCKCFHCREKTLSTLRDGPLDSGCVRVIALSEVLSLLAHGIADALGCPDVSALSWRDNSEPLAAIAMRLLNEMSEETMYWDTWFSLAAAVYTGCAKELHERLVDHFSASGDRDSSYATIQYGNMAVLAPWLDLESPMTMRQCFKVIFEDGRVATATRGRDSKVRYQDSGTEFAVIQPLPTECTSSYVGVSKKLAVTAGSTVTSHPDEDEAWISVMLVADQEDKHRFFVRAHSNSHSRVVDPCHAMFQRFGAFSSTTCDHQQYECTPSTIVEDTYILYQYTFDELLGRWAHREKWDREAAECPEESRDNEAPDSAKNKASLCDPLDTHLKLNLALALSGPEPPMLRFASACHTCSLRYAHQDRFDFHAKATPRPRKLSQHCYIISLCDILIEGQRLLE